MRRISGSSSRYDRQAGDARRHARARGQQPHDQILLAARRRHREHAAASDVRLARIGRDTPDHLVILVEPDQVVAIQLAAAREQPLAQLGRLRRPGRAARRIDVRVRIGAMIEQQIHHRRVPRARRRMQRRTARRFHTLAPRGIGAPLQQQPHDRVVPELDRRGQRPLATRPLLANARGILVEKRRHARRDRRAPTRW